MNVYVDILTRLCIIHILIVNINRDILLYNIFYRSLIVSVVVTVIGIGLKIRIFRCEKIYSIFISAVKRQCLKLLHRILQISYISSLFSASMIIRKHCHSLIYRNLLWNIGRNRGGIRQK